MTSTFASKPEMTLLNFFRSFTHSKAGRSRSRKQEKKPSEKEFFKQAKMGTNTQGSRERSQSAKLGTNAQGSRERSQSAKQASGKRKYGEAAGAAPQEANTNAQKPQRKPPVTVPVTPPAQHEVPPAMPSEDQEQPFESALSGVEDFIDQNACTISRTISKSVQFTARSSISGVGIGRPTVGDVVTVVGTGFTRQYRAESIGQRCVITVDDPCDDLVPYQLEGCSGCFGEKDVRACGVSKLLREINGCREFEVRAKKKHATRLWARF